MTRDQFRAAVFERDNNLCIFCGAPAVDAHHIIERRLFGENQGYFLDNGASVCEDHHLQCEMTTLSVEDVRNAANIKRVIVPDQFYPEQPITKWGDYILPNGQRTPGELFHDDSVQKILKRGGMLDRYVQYVKYGRTFHLPWSPGLHDDDKALIDCSQFEGKRVIVSLKLDGENTSMYSNYIHARSLDSRGGEDRAWVKRFWSCIAHDIPEGWRICGENLWAEHSISYQSLPSYFLGFSMWNERNICLSWDETLLYFQLLGITPVPVLYDGLFSVNQLHEIEKTLSWEKDEGYVVRLADQFHYGQFKTSVAKYVRVGHVQTAKHWRAGRVLVPNKLTVAG